jgi:hypothetical protein
VSMVVEYADGATLTTDDLVVPDQGELNVVPFPTPGDATTPKPVPITLTITREDLVALEIFVAGFVTMSYTIHAAEEGIPYVAFDQATGLLVQIAPSPDGTEWHFVVLFEGTPQVIASGPTIAEVCRRAALTDLRDAYRALAAIA